jgi:hypothetical protein
MSMRTKSLVPVFLTVLAVAACGESPTSPTSPLPPVQSEPWTGSTGVLWAQRSDPVTARTTPARGRGEADGITVQEPGRQGSRDSDVR